MKTARRRGESTDRENAKLFLRAGLAFWLIQALVLASFALRLMFSNGEWVVHFEQFRMVRMFMANPVEMIAVEAFGTLCILVGIFGIVETRGDLLDVAWAGYGPFFIGLCLLLLFVHGLFQPWWLFR